MSPLPPAGLDVHLGGGVINLASTGAAIEIKDLAKDDRATLEALYNAHKSLLDAPPTTTPPTPRSERVLADARPERTSQGMATEASQGQSENVGFRRHVTVTKPDLEIVSQSSMGFDQHSNVEVPDEFYEPSLGWVKLDDQTPPVREETLTEDRLLDVMLQLSSHQFSGMVQINQEARGSAESAQWQFSFDAGMMCDVKVMPRQARAELGHMLRMAKRLSKTQLEVAAAHAEEQSSSLARSIFDLELMPAPKLTNALAGRITFLLRYVCTSAWGTVSIYADDVLPQGYLPMPPLRVHVPVEGIIYQILSERFRQMPTAAREKTLATEIEAYPEVVGGDQERVASALGDPKLEQLVARVATGRKRLREVITESSLPGTETFALLFSLHRMGLIQFDRSLHHTVVRERFRENVTVKYLSVHKASYFEVLNVHWSSYDTIVERAYKELVVQFDPANVPNNLEPEVHQRVREIRDRIESAFQVLSRREHRHAYRTRIMPEYKLQHALPLFFKQCELAERRGHHVEALDSLKRVLELKPDDKEARGHMKRIREHIKEGGLSEPSSSVL